MYETVILFIILIIAYSIFKYWNSTPYIIYEIPNFLTHEECDKLMKLSTPLLENSNVYRGDTDTNDPNYRISQQCWLQDSVPFANYISEKVEKLSGHPKAHQEQLQVVKYEKGGHFNTHYDACFGTDTFCERLNSPIGPRYITVLIYLNDDYTGGGTTFPRINQKITPEKGKAILFYNVDEKGRLLFASLHAGNKIESGTKWIANKWIRIPVEMEKTFINIVPPWI